MTTLAIGAFFGFLICGALVAFADRMRNPEEVCRCRCFICEPCSLRIKLEENTGSEND